MKMTLKGKGKTVAALAGMAMVLFSCITFNSVVWPSNPKANSGSACS